MSKANDRLREPFEIATAKEVLLAASRGQGALGKAADDEPVFVLRAADFLAPDAIEKWCESLEREMMDLMFREIHSYATREEPAIDTLIKRAQKVNNARDLASRMRSWQRVNVAKTKFPD